MKKLVTNLMVSVCLVFLTSAATFAGTYVSAFGANFKPSDSRAVNTLGPDYNVSFDNGYDLGVAIGSDAPLIRPELEISYKSAPMSSKMTGTRVSGKEWILAMMLNLYYDIKNSTPFTPFIHGGLGGARIAVPQTPEISNDSAGAYAWQYGAGLSYKITERVKADVSFKHFTADSSKVSSSNTSFNATSNEFQIGIRVQLPD